MMPDMKFSCPHCGQHISCGEPWAGHQIECPTCHNHIIVPAPQRPSPPKAQAASVQDVDKVVTPSLAAGATQVARSTAHAPAQPRKFAPREAGSGRRLLEYGAGVIVVAAVVGLGWIYGLPYLKEALPEKPAATGSSTPQAGATRGGPLGEVTEAMDASDALDGASSANPRPAAATNRVSRAQPGAPRK